MFVLFIIIYIVTIYGTILCLGLIIIILRLKSLTSAIDVSCTIGICSDDGTVLYNDSIFSATYQFRWHSVWQRRWNIRVRSIRRSFHFISAHRSFLAAAIDVFQYRGFALNGDRTGTTYQSRVAMCLYACTGSEYVAFD